MTRFIPRVVVCFAFSLSAALAAGPPAGSAAAPAAHAAARPAAHPAAGVSEPEGYWSGDINAPVPASIHGGKVIHAEQLGNLVVAGTAVIVDVSNAPTRPADLAPEAPWMPPFHRGIPGALWIPGVGLGTLPDAADAYFRDRLAALTGKDLSKPIVVYCHERCWLSWNAAKRAIGYGYTHVSWFPEGIEGWRKTGMATGELQPEKVPHESAPAQEGASGTG